MHINNILVSKKAFGSLFLTLFFISILGLAEASENPIKLLDIQGSLFEGKNDSFEAVKKAEPSDGWNALRIGAEAEPESFVTTPSKLAEAHAIAKLGNRMVLTLSNGTRFEHAISEKEQKPVFKLAGVAHLLVNESEEKQPAVFFLGDLRLETNRLHLFYNNLGESPQLTILEGSVELTVAVEKVKPIEKKAGDATGDIAVQTAADATGDAAPAVSAAADATADTPPAPAAVTREIVTETVKLEAFDRILIKKGGYEIEKKVDPKTDMLLLKSTVPGFEAPGPYKGAGQVGFDGESLQIKRYGKTSSIKQSPARVMEGDEIMTSASQTAMVQLTKNDLIRLSQNTTFTVANFEFKEKSVSSILAFSGKIRARIAKRKKRSRVRFKTATAVIGIKGTVFESSATAETTNVETVQGTVGVANPDGQGEVSVKAGEMTSVAANELPKKPEPIPADRWQQLQQGLIPVAAATAVPLNNITVVSPAEGQVYRTPMLKLQVEPEDASLVFLLDGQPFAVEDGDTLHYLTEGPHQLVVKGATEGSATQTVSFTIDKTAPALFPDTQLEELTLRQFMPFNLSWSEPVTSLAVLFNGSPLPVTLSADGKISAIDSTPLFVNTTSGQLVTLAFESKDESGNTTQFEKSIQIKFRPAAPPLISIEGGKQLINIRLPQAVSAISSREIEQWTVELDQKPLVLTPAPKDPAAQTDKKVLVVPAVHFTQLVEGKHALTISGSDDFGMIGKQTLTIIVDRTPPVLQQPLSLLNPIEVMTETRMLTVSNLVVKEGESIIMKWSEPVNNVLFKLTGLGMQLPLPPLEIPMTSRLEAEQIKQMLGSVKVSPVMIEAKDEAGNIVQLQGNIRYLPKPETAPAIKISSGSGKLVLKEASSFNVDSDRELFQWQITLDGSPIILPPAPATGSGTRKVELKKELLPEMKDGDHRLVVSGSDQFNIKGQGEITFSIDSTGPALVALPADVKLSSIKLRQDEILSLKWNEKLSRTESTLDGKPWPVILASGDTEVILKGDKETLSYTPKPFQLKAIDQVGNATVVEGQIALKKPRKMALRDSYNDSILELSRTSIDEMTLANRPDFQLNNAKPVLESGGSRLLEKVEFKQNPNTDFFDLLDEPLANSF